MSGRRRFKRVYHHFSKWEEPGGMWAVLAGPERKARVVQCAAFMENTAGFRAAMLRVIDDWPVSCEVNFTNTSNNRQAWLGHAACYLAIGSPEGVTREAWWRLTQEQREAGDAAAAEVIELWEIRYTEALRAT